MGRNLDPKCRQCRRIGEKLFLKAERCFSAKCAMVKKNYPPGMHGQKGFSKSSEYGKQLAAKQRAKKTYRIQEKQFRGYFDKAAKMKGNVSVNFLTLLESRFDNVVYRTGLAESRDQARQLVGHAHFLINGKKTNIPSRILKEKDVITVREKSKKNNILSKILENIKVNDIHDWLSYDAKEQSVTIVGKPEEKDFETGIDARLIVEFYSR